jgi:hypothetical protein
MWGSILSLFAIILVVFLINILILSLIYAIIKRFTNRAAQISIPLLVMLTGYLILMNADPANLILGTHFFVLPMTLLIAVFLIPGLADPLTGFTRILLGDLFATIIAIVILGFVISSEALNTLQYYRNMPLSNGITYAGVIVFDLVLAIVLFKLMRKRKGYPVRAREES